MIAEVNEDALVIIFHQACDGAPVVAQAEEAVEDDDGVAGAVGFMIEFQAGCRLYVGRNWTG